MAAAGALAGERAQRRRASDAAVDRVPSAASGTRKQPSDPSAVGADSEQRRRTSEVGSGRNSNFSYASARDSDLDSNLSALSPGGAGARPLEHRVTAMGTIQSEHMHKMSSISSVRKRASEVILDELREEDKGTSLCPYQLKAAEFYLHRNTEIVVALLICGNFLTNLVEGTIDPQKDKYVKVFAVFEDFFNIAFAIELAINMYSTWFRHFWKDAWNWFDLLVVSIGMLSTFRLQLPGPLKMLRMARAFRVFRVFKRVESLKVIVASIMAAIPGVINAFGILMLVMSIYAILAVEFWSLYGTGGEMVNEQGQTIPLQTSRGQDYGWEYFGNFPKSLYTMFQVLTGESWAEAVARPLIHQPDLMVAVLTAFFFSSFVVINAIILINVVVAVLVGQMLDYAEKEKQARLGFEEPSASDSAAEAFCQIEGETFRDHKDDSNMDTRVKCTQPSPEEQRAPSKPSEPPPAELWDLVKDVDIIHRDLDEVKCQLVRVAKLVERRRRCQCARPRLQPQHNGHACAGNLAGMPRAPGIQQSTMGAPASPKGEEIAALQPCKPELPPQLDRMVEAPQLPIADLPRLSGSGTPGSPGQGYALPLGVQALPPLQMKCPGQSPPMQSKITVPSPKVQDTLFVPMSEAAQEMIK